MTLLSLLLARRHPTNKLPKSSTAIRYPRTGQSEKQTVQLSPMSTYLTSRPGDHELRHWYRAEQCNKNTSGETSKRTHSSGLGKLGQIEILHLPSVAARDQLEETEMANHRPREECQGSPCYGSSSKTTTLHVLCAKIIYGLLSMVWQVTKTHSREGQQQHRPIRASLGIRAFDFTPKSGSVQTFCPCPRQAARNMKYCHSTANFGRHSQEF